MPTKQSIIVTGGAGFIGSHLVDAFVLDGHRVIVVDDLSNGRREQVHRGAELHVLDIRSAAAARLVVDSGATVLCHQAAQVDVRRSVAEPLVGADINVLGLLNLLDAAREGDIEQVLFASSGGTIYGEQERFPADEEDPARPISPYGASKLAAEAYLYCHHRVHGLDVSVLRYGNVYGPRQIPYSGSGVVANFIDRLLRGKRPIVFGDGEQTRDYVYVDDIVAANRRCLGLCGFHRYNVGTGVETSLNRLLAELHGLVGGPEPRLVDCGVGELRRSAIGSRRLREALGVRIEVGLDEGLPTTVQWFRDSMDRTRPLESSSAANHGVPSAAAG